MIRFQTRCGLAAVCLLALGCGGKTAPLRTGGNYPAVTKQRLTGASYSHRTGPDEPPLDWQFAAGQMTLVSKGEALPTELVDAILGAATSASPRSVKQITAAWSISDETLTLDEIRYDESSLSGQRTLRIFNTGVIRIEAAGDQYVFTPSRQ